MVIKIGNIFESRCHTLVNTVNCVGVMGKGIALEFRQKYPGMFKDYVHRCDTGELRPGRPYVYSSEECCVLIFPTKDHWRSPSRISYIEKGLDWFAEHYQEYGITSIAFPPLGCGNGGLPWSSVGPLMYEKLSILPIDVEIYAPFGCGQKELSIDFLSKSVAHHAHDV